MVLDCVPGLEDVCWASGASGAACDVLDAVTAEPVEDVEIEERVALVVGETVTITALFMLTPSFEQMCNRDSSSTAGNVRPSEQTVDSAACCTGQDLGMLIEV